MVDWSTANTVVTYVFLAVLALASWRDRRFLALLGWQSWLVVVNLLRQPVDQAYDRADSLQRLWLHVDQALYLSVGFAFVWACGRLFEARRGGLIAVGAWAASLVALVLVRSFEVDAAAVVYTAASVVALLTCWAFVLRAVFGRVRPQYCHLAAMVVLAGDTVNRLYGFIDLAPEGMGAFAASWDAIRAVNTLSLGLAAGIAALSLTREVKGPARG